MFKCRIIIRYKTGRSSSEDCKCCLLSLQCEALCVWGIPGRLCGPDWQALQWWVTAYHKGKTSLCVGCMGSSSLCGCSHEHACVETNWKQVFFLYIQDTTFKTFHSSSPLDVQVGKRSISEVRVTYTNPSADVTVSELGKTRAAGWIRGQGPLFRDCTGQSFSVHFSLLHFISSTWRRLTGN